MNKITEFKGEFRWLSNFWPVEGGFFKGKTVEHFFQAAKTDDGDEYDSVINCETPGQAKRMGRKITLSFDWEEWKVAEMKALLWAKFDPEDNPGLAQMLIDTGDAILEEGNSWNDRFWGICPPGSNNGENMLGKLLMEIREELKNAQN